MSEDVTKTSLPTDAETLRTLVKQQAEAVAKLTRELEQLKFAYQKLLKDRYGRKSEKLAAGQLALFELPEDSPPSVWASLASICRSTVWKTSSPAAVWRFIAVRSRDGCGTPRSF